jgi:hypothetical protein
MGIVILEMQQVQRADAGRVLILSQKGIFGAACSTALPCRQRTMFTGCSTIRCSKEASQRSQIRRVSKMDAFQTRASASTTNESPPVMVSTISVYVRIFDILSPCRLGTLDKFAARCYEGAHWDEISVFPSENTAE